jgi:outer membrane receptor protein involved in Fe transport
VFTLNQADLQGIGGFVPGNPDAEAEESDSYTAGVVITPRSVDFLRNFAFTVDYFNIKVNNAIAVIPFQFIVNQCAETGAAEFCNRITRLPTNQGPNSAGSIQNINTSTINFGYLRTEGVDFTASWRQNLDDWGLDGTLNVRVSYTMLLAGEQQVVGGTIDPFAGEVGAAKDRIFGTVSWENEGVGLTLRGNYVGESFIDDQFTGLPQDDATANDFRVPPEFTVDAQARFKAGDNYEFFVGVDNLLDETPPPVINGLPGSVTGTETAASVYDPIGRRYYAGARIRF